MILHAAVLLISLGGRCAFGAESSCVSCHADLLKGPVIHAAAQDDGCQICHTNEKKTAKGHSFLLSKPVPQLCFDCHDDARQLYESRNIKHPPFADGLCTSCHNPHSSVEVHLLQASFPQAFYNPYASDLYALCFSCHDADMAAHLTASTPTGFRNGEINLHYIHVNSPKGRSCKVCHEVHAGAQEKLIRSDVPFGSASFSIKFSSTPEGGSCAAACHKAKTYSRGRSEP